MCGLLGVFGPAADQPAVALQELSMLRHRGPDETLTAHGHGYALGFQRLAVIDVEGSHQPLSYPPSGPDAGRQVLVFNGEIYNHHELRELLASEYGAVFTTKGDAEVVAAAHYYWGAAAALRLRGMFAYVVWDRVTGRASGARDRFGIKPLYYHAADGSLSVASEKKALERVAGALVLDTAALSQYLTMQFVPEPATMHAQVRRLPPGTVFDFTPGHQIQIQRYWQPTFSPARFAAPATVATGILDALRDSVRAHLVADVPVGAFLSGGIDSTGIVALARETHPDIRTFSVGFDLPGYSELEVAAESARWLGVPNSQVLVSPADVIDHLTRIVWHLDDPVADPAIVPLYFLAREAAKHVTVVLSGEGADELFGGYGIYREPLSLAPLTALPGQLRRALGAAAEHLPDGTRGKSLLQRSAVDLAERYFGNARIFTDTEKAILLRGHLQPARHTAVTGPLYAEAAALDDVTTMQYIDLHTWLPGDILAKADRMSMAHSLELRVPYLDPAVFDQAARLPAEQKVTRRRQTKLALRRALQDVVPPGIADRPKLGLPTPTRVWLRGEVGEWADTIFTTSSAAAHLDLNFARQLLHAHRRGEGDHSRKVWTILVFCIWYALASDGRLAPEPSLPARWWVL